MSMTTEERELLFEMADAVKYLLIGQFTNESLAIPKYLKALREKMGEARRAAITEEMSSGVIDRNATFYDELIGPIREFMPEGFAFKDAAAVIASLIPLINVLPKKFKTGAPK